MDNQFNFLGDLQTVLRGANDLDQVFGVVQQFATDLQLENVAYGCFSGEVGLPGQAPAVRLNYPASWIELYFQEHFFEVDPVVTRIIKAGRLMHWTQLAQTGKERAFLKLAAGHGLKHGFSLPLFGPMGGNYVFSFSGRDKVHDEQTVACHLLGSLAHARLLEAIDVMAPPSQDMELTDQQKAILRGLADGKTTRQMADDLAITVDGVNYHLKAAKKVLGTVNTTHTIAVAIRNSLI